MAIDDPAGETLMDNAGEIRERRPAPDSVHLLRTTQQVQYQLSQMADQKASILLGITFVIFTISLSQAHGAAPPVPLLVLGAAAFVAAFLTVMAVLPSVKKPPKIGDRGNVLFFATYTQMSEDEYVRYMLDLTCDHERVYEAFIRDIHQNGSVLARKKYKLLGYAYRVLLAGMLGSLVAFVAPFVTAWISASPPPG